MVMNHFHLWDDPMGCERLFEDQQQLLSPGQSDVLREKRHGHGFTGKKNSHGLTRQTWGISLAFKSLIGEIPKIYHDVRKMSLMI